MKYTYEQYEAFYYLHKLLPYLQSCCDFEENFVWFNRACGADPLVPFRTSKKENKEDRIKFLKKIIRFFDKPAPCYLKQPTSLPQQNIRQLSKLFGLSSAEENLITFFTVVRKNRLFNRVLQRFQHDYYENNTILEVMADMPNGNINSLLKSTAPLLRLGFFQRRGYSADIYASAWLEEYVNNTHRNSAEICSSILGKPIDCETVLGPKNFSYVEAADLALRLIKQAKHTKGFNILLYGIPGTGKTSFAKLLAKTARLMLYPAGVCNEGEEERNYRLQQLYRKQCLLEKIDNTCILFDEGEDIFSSLETRTSKMEINNLLENNEVPVIWTTNKIHRMDPAFIRRFTLAVCFNKPPVEVRQKIWNKYLTENKITCGKEDSLKLAKKYEVPPSMIAGAAQAAHMAKGDLNTVKEHLSFMTQALNGGYKKPEENTENAEFETALINADMNLDLLTQQIKRLGRLNFSLCLYGASGTGKSAYARYLAQELGLDVLHRRASDLLSKWVGGTEQNIAEAFAQAKENKSLLIFDEADSFLRDRATASHSWEISGVNEMLTWMESHPYPFICTTNLMDTLDPASLRRFSFKVKYEFLKAQQVQMAFEHFFGVKVSVQDVASLATLTPGDFALVKNKAEILGVLKQPEKLKELLQTEQKVKMQHTTGQIGFCPR